MYFVRAGWLLRLARRVYCHSGHPLAVHPSPALLQRSFKGLRVGGKSELDGHVIRHQVPARSILRLYGWSWNRLPEWFAGRFPSEYRRRRIFAEEPEALLHVWSCEKDRNAPLVSAPERALLEMLSEVGTRQPLQEAREIMEGTFTLWTNVLRELPSKCRSIKKVRLCLNLGSELSVAWAARHDTAQLPKGSSRPWVSRLADSVLVLKP